MFRPEKSKGFLPGGTVVILEQEQGHVLVAQATLLNNRLDIALIHSFQSKVCISNALTKWGLHNNRRLRATFRGRRLFLVLLCFIIMSHRRADSA